MISEEVGNEGDQESDNKQYEEGVLRENLEREEVQQGQRKRNTENGGKESLK